MRKKTIQEELEELEREKEEHIEKVSKSTGHSDDHVYDFDAKYETHEFDDSSASSGFEINNTKKSTLGTKNSHGGPIVGIFYFIFILPCLALIGASAFGLYLMIGVGIIPLSKDLSFVEVTSVVQHVEVEHMNDEFYANLEVAFTYNDSPIVCTISKHINSMEDVPEIGDDITLKINPNNPYEAYIATNNTIDKILIIVSGFLVAAFCGLGVSKLIKGLICSRNS